MYFATGAGHAPHHAPAEWIDKYRGKFDMGWEKARETIFQSQKEMGVVPPNTDLTPRPHWIQEWDTLPQDEKTLYARMMEVFAGFISHTDHHIGRVIDFIDELGELDNTIIVAISDNGASAEGGPNGSLNEAAFFNRMPESVGECLNRIDELGTPRAYNHYPFGWAWAGNTPFQRWKREVHEGGVADFCVVHWPKGIEASGEVRGQYAHVVDVTPTILELLNVQSPHQIRGVTQTPMQGTSFARTLNEAGAESDHETQYYEMLGNRAIYHNGWKAVTYHGTEGMIYDGVTDPSKPFDEDQWELYHITEDFSECHDLAAELPDKLRELQDIWLVEAARNNVLPLQATFSGRGRNRPRPGGRRHRYVYRPGGAPIEYFAAANVKNRSHTITAEVEIPPEGAEGVLLSVGSRFGGFVLYVKDRRLRFDYNLLSRGHYKLQSSEDIPAGRCTLGYSFEKRGNQPFGAGGPRACTSTTASWRSPTSESPSRCCSESAKRCAAATTAERQSAMTTRRPLPSRESSRKWSSTPKGARCATPPRKPPSASPASSAMDHDTPCCAPSAGRSDDDGSAITRDVRPRGQRREA